MSVLGILSKFGGGRRQPTDPFFCEGDAVVRADRREGVVLIDDEDMCHQIVEKFPCHVLGCSMEFDSLMQYELHYNSSHRYHCSECRKQFPSPHLLDLHISETHDSFFLVQAEKKSMYRCYIEHCSSKFSSPLERRNHCIDYHKFPPNFKFDSAKKHKSKHKSRGTSRSEMEVDLVPGEEVDAGPRLTLKPSVLSRDKQRTNVDKVKFVGFSRGKNRFCKTGERCKADSSDHTKAFHTSELMEALDNQADNTTSSG